MKLEVTILELIVRGIPESFLIILGIYSITKTSLDKKKWVYSSMIICILVFLIRLLPIRFGIHTIIILFATNILAISINKINMLSSLKATLSILAIQFVSEAINVVLIVNLVSDAESVLQNPITKIISAIPSSILLFLVVWMIYSRNLREKQGDKS